VGGKAAAAVARPVLGLLARRPLDGFAVVLAAGLAVQIGVNALFMQEGRHPAPFFEAAPMPRPNLRTSPMPKPTTEERTGSLAALANEPPAERVRAVQAALAAAGKYDGPVDGVYGKRTSAAILAYELAAGLPPTGEPSQAILEHLVPKRAGVPVPRAKAEGATMATMAAAAAAPAPAAPAPSPRVLAAQKALAKLGYGPVRLDGVPGTATKQAISRFEADRKLPVTGELSTRVVKEIASVSGMPVN
jgi:peptidoglycan hydrolase-like protein with peptidoglycan-binding domain